MIDLERAKTYMLTVDRFYLSDADSEGGTYIERGEEFRFDNTFIQIRGQMIKAPNFLAVIRSGRYVEEVQDTGGAERDMRSKPEAPEDSSGKFRVSDKNEVAASYGDKKKDVKETGMKTYRVEDGDVGNADEVATIERTAKHNQANRHMRVAVPGVPENDFVVKDSVVKTDVGKQERLYDEVTGSESGEHKVLPDTSEEYNTVADKQRGILRRGVKTQESEDRRNAALSESRGEPEFESVINSSMRDSGMPVDESTAKKVVKLPMSDEPVATVKCSADRYIGDEKAEERVLKPGILKHTGEADYDDTDGGRFDLKGNPVESSSEWEGKKKELPPKGRVVESKACPENIVITGTLESRAIDSNSSEGAVGSVLYAQVFGDDGGFDLAPLRSMLKERPDNFEDVFKGFIDMVEDESVLKKIARMHLKSDSLRDYVKERIASFE